MITKEKLNNLKELAQKATPGPWNASGIVSKSGNWNQTVWSGAKVICEMSNKGYCVSKENSAYIASASPDVMLALIEEIESLRYILSLVPTDQEDDVRDYEKNVAKLEKEADWLAKKLIRACPNALDCKGCEVRIHCPKLDFQDWRKAAREAVEKENESHKSPD